MMFRGFRVGLFFFPVALFVTACGPKVTPERAVATAYQYSKLMWMPEQRHVRHGPDSAGRRVDTPDVSLADLGDPKGYWKPGVPARGMPYKWGGFDTPESFLIGLEAGKKAGDIGGKAKRRLDQAAVSDESVGIDCSGLISRCWNLDRPYSTKELPQICTELKSWQDLAMGDILLKDGHVLLFKTWSQDGKSIIGYEAGPFPKWRVNACQIRAVRLKAEGYTPWRYNKMED
ncbi:hypothetical protein JIN85_18255 [Luteolibacter pohnpeiensis]|uniref:NlpC/P60 domain-containing protein n=1 Tax=Luteolibacter pohnpeiensis TaxID=454153 RepID=A0A934S7X9_9BACT|nr:hypothetical protein [Luteolibacter pohnpeiensis]MBK1884366.1 hypothetical protein [Luteolibacter pohnpeiensis]